MAEDSFTLYEAKKTVSSLSAAVFFLDEEICFREPQFTPAVNTMGLPWRISILWLLLSAFQACSGTRGPLQADDSNIRKIPVSPIADVSGFFNFANGETL